MCPGSLVEGNAYLPSHHLHEEVCAVASGMGVLCVIGRCVEMPKSFFIMS